MNKRVVRLVCEKHKLVSAGFAKLQIWTGCEWHYFMNQKYANGCMLLDLGVQHGGLQVGERIQGQRASKNMVAVQTIILDQNEDEVDSLKIFKITPLGFCIKLNHMILQTSHNFGGSQKEIFKRVVVQNCPLDQRRKTCVILKICNEMNILMHKVIQRHHRTSPNFGGIFS